MSSLANSVSGKESAVNDLEVELSTYGLIGFLMHPAAFKDNVYLEISVKSQCL